MAVSTRPAARIRALAKINLSLEITGVRSDGYHELQTVFQSIALHDTLTFSRERGPFRIETDDPACPVDRSNLVWRAARRAWTASGRRGAPRGLVVRIDKRIPVAGGLGGGSSDAAAALRALGVLWRVEAARLRSIAASLGMDVPYFLEGGTVLGLGRGDRLFPLIDRASSWIALVIPSFGVSTKEAYGWWDARGRTSPAGVANDLQPPVAAQHPEISRLVNALRRAGATSAAMSGSGSTVFGLFDRRADAEEAAGTLFRPGRRALVTRTVNRSEYQRLAAIAAHRINLPFASRRSGHS
jgi:4-diphosphocytidyl-2-C-methyl-D-erythritol kinase